MTREEMLKECVTPNEEVFSMCLEHYQQGRADATKELPTSLYCDGFNDGYSKGRADAIDEVIKSLEAQFLMQNNPNSKFVETIVLHRDFIDALEQLKGNSNER